MLSLCHAPTCHPTRPTLSRRQPAVRVLHASILGCLLSREPRASSRYDVSAALTSHSTSLSCQLRAELVRSFVGTRSLSRCFVNPTDRRRVCIPRTPTAVRHHSQVCCLLSSFVGIAGNIISLLNSSSSSKIRQTPWWLFSELSTQLIRSNQTSVPLQTCRIVD